MRYPGRESNPHAKRLGILSPLCIPIPPPGPCGRYAYLATENGTIKGLFASFGNKAV